VVATRKMLKAMPSSEVWIQQYTAPLPTRYFRTVMAGIPVVQCRACNRFFDGDNFEAAVLKTGACPFCRSKVDIHGERDAAKTALAGVPAGVSQA
jgi:hypothetical protein